MLAITAAIVAFLVAVYFAWCLHEATTDSNNWQTLFNIAAKEERYERQRADEAVANVCHWKGEHASAVEMLRTMCLHLETFVAEGQLESLESQLAEAEKIASYATESDDDYDISEEEKYEARTAHFAATAFSDDDDGSGFDAIVEDAADRW